MCALLLPVFGWAVWCFWKQPKRQKLPESFGSSMEVCDISTTQLCSVTQHTYSTLRLLICLSETIHLFRYSGLQPLCPIIRTCIPARGLLLLIPRPRIGTRIPLRGLLLLMSHQRQLTGIPIKGLLQRTLTMVPLVEKWFSILNCM
jgi:hypothetical protein